MMLISSIAFAQSMISKVIELNYINADRAITLLQPVLERGEKISGSQQTIVLNVKPETLTKVRSILHQIDKPPVTFQISVYQGDPNWLNSKQRNVRVYSSQSRKYRQRRQSVKVMNGESAFIATNRDVPIIQSVGIGFWQTGINLQQRRIENGILVQPVMQGSKVKLKVRRIREQQVEYQNQEFDNQQTATTMMLPVNEWVALSSAEGAKGINTNPNIARTYGAGAPYAQNSTLYIKVEVLKNSSSNILK